MVVSDTVPDTPTLVPDTCALATPKKASLHCRSWLSTLVIIKQLHKELKTDTPIEIDGYAEMSLDVARKFQSPFGTRPGIIPDCARPPAR